MTTTATVDGTTTVPLTTIFTQPAACSTHWTYEGNVFNSWPGGILMQNIVREGIDTTCFPSGWQGFGRAFTNQVFSPGACPVGYTTQTAISGGGTTTAVCCYSGYAFYGTISTINFGGTGNQVFAGCTSSLAEGSVTSLMGRIHVTEDSKYLTPTVVTGPINMWAQAFTVEYQFRDLALYPALTSSTSSSAQATSTSSTSATTSTAAPASSSTPSLAFSTSFSSSATSSSPTTPSVAASDSSTSTSSLPTGAQIGIGIGVAAVVFSIITLAFLLWRSKRKSKNPRDSHHAYPWPGSYPPPYYEGGALVQQQQQASSQPASELYGMRNTRDNAVELEGSYITRDDSK